MGNSAENESLKQLAETVIALGKLIANYKSIVLLGGCDVLYHDARFMVQQLEEAQDKVVSGYTCEKLRIEKTLEVQ